jgi:hypothetical protein
MCVAIRTLPNLIGHGHARRHENEVMQEVYVYNS